MYSWGGAWLVAGGGGRGGEAGKKKKKKIEFKQCLFVWRVGFCLFCFFWVTSLFNTC